MVTKKLIIIALIFLSTGLSAKSPLKDEFVLPNEEARPWTFWYWMHGAVTKPALKADLVAMKEAGLAGYYLFPIRGPEGKNFPGAVNQLTPEWWEMVRYTMQVTDSLGLQMGMHISDGFALAGGPWISPEESMQKVVYSDTIIRGGKINRLKIRQPETIQGYYEDIALFAFPAEKALMKTPECSISSNLKEFPQPFAVPGVDFRSENPCYIQYTYKKPFTLKSIEITPAGNNLQSQRMVLWAGDDGIHFRKIRQMVPPRQGWQNTGFNNTFSIPPVKARYFRLTWTPEGTEPGSEDMDAGKWKPTLKIKAIKMHSSSRINLWEGKAGLVWRIGEASSSEDIPDESCIAPEKMINLTTQLKNGELSCKLPAGNWRILRMGHTSTGHTNATGGGGKGLECDKFSEKAVQKQFDNWFGAIFEKTDPVLARKVLKYMHIDSWECGSQNWSSNFAGEFKQRRGYDLMPWLPVLAGFPVESAARSELVLKDVRTTIVELVNDVFFKVMVQNAHAHDCEVSAEAIAPTMVSDGMRHYSLVDLPMGEFWLRSPTHDKPNDMLDAISGAHIYGKNIIQSESFTQLRTFWDEHPGMLKSLLDRNFALGINRLFFHVMTHNPYPDKGPGMTLSGMGLYFQRDQTWWKQSKAFTDYIARCQVLLQTGQPVTDIAVYTGEEIPQRAYTPEKLVPFLPGIIGNEQVEMEKQRMANVGQPMRELPAGVNNSANIFDISRWTNPLNGYAYDSFNKDILMNSAKTSSGKLVLSDVTSYPVVIFPHSEKYSTETRAKIAELRSAGVYVPELPFTAKDFSAQGIEPDVIAPENIAWTHRMDGDRDIYFISNQEDAFKKINISFRIQEKIPTCWQAVDGTINAPSAWKVEKNRIEVQLELHPSGSVFVVFEPDFTVSGSAKAQKSSVPASSIVLKNTWQINFLRNDLQVDTNSLFDWSKHANPKIHYYSGTAVYKTTFKPDSLASIIQLDLGDVYHLATVKVNGHDCGTLWTKPFVTDISKAVVKGVNILEIEVTNTWANAIKGSDKGMPPFEGIWTDGQYRMKEDRLIESGLKGPVRIIYQRE